MADPLYGYLPHYELSLLQRMSLIWAFIACGLVIALQIAQSWAEPRPRWTLLDERNKHYWYTFYVLEAFLTMQITYRPLAWKLEELGLGGGVGILDAVWIALLGLEAAMVAGVVALRVSRAFGGSPTKPGGGAKQKEL
ncbi:hypothetical protein DL766_010423 [Monosporascus sp. MC13-8B]|uniref:Uncharacterized protein n=1 Tax=Monosporascus cannonballus TaxID=155416 RepID=A0ABY0HJG6_9PEZI|nr:hypothetical protein DL763_005664 [Monosporascus cannonballus]RYO93881.1 hypothetical protein DL762_000836 [Monosporascus cannonballus]RYP02336.1 hypothetical protein DL766_010423 [Monosporascus sp. MC13-8B]